jgi:hypothetical protein
MPTPTFNPLLWPCGEENMGGFSNRIAIIPVCMVNSAPTLPDKADVNSLEDLAVAEGSFTFKNETDKPIAVRATDKTVSYSAENQGEIDGRSFAVSGSFFFPGTLTETSSFARMVNNTPCYIVIEDFNGEQVLVGQPGLPASIAPAYAGGQARADRKGMTFNYTADSVAPYIKLGTPLNLDSLFAAAENPSGTTSENPAP